MLLLRGCCCPADAAQRGPLRAVCLTWRLGWVGSVSAALIALAHTTQHAQATHQHESAADNEDTTTGTRSSESGEGRGSRGQSQCSSAHHDDSAMCAERTRGSKRTRGRDTRGERGLHTASMGKHAETKRLSTVTATQWRSRTGSTRRCDRVGRTNETGTARWVCQHLLRHTVPLAATATVTAHDRNALASVLAGSPRCGWCTHALSNEDRASSACTVFRSTATASSSTLCSATRARKPRTSAVLPHCCAARTLRIRTADRDTAKRVSQQTTATPASTTVPRRARACRRREPLCDPAAAAIHARSSWLSPRCEQAIAL